MSRLILVLRSLVHFRRTHLGITLGVAISAAVLVGALVVGDSVRLSLRDQALERIGGVDWALFSHDRFFREALCDDLASRLEGMSWAPGCQLASVATLPDGSARASDVRLFGVDSRFFDRVAKDAPQTLPGKREVFLSARLARQLDVSLDDVVILRAEKPSALPRDMVMATNEDANLALRVQVKAILEADNGARFGLQAEPLPPFNAFVDLDWLQREFELGDRCNLLLASRDDEKGVPLEPAQAALQQAWTLEDGELEWEGFDDASQLSSPRVFLDPGVGDVATKCPPSLRILTYFVNEIRHGERATPYSMVASLEGHGELPDAWDPSPFVPDDLEDDEIVIHRWLADDLGAEPGDLLQIRYFEVGPSRALEEVERSFTVHSIVPMEGLAIDDALMPEFPGISDSEDCQDWDPGIPLDLDRIRDVDETYWDDYGGAPKAFVKLAVGQALWANRFGNLTSVRVPPTHQETFSAFLRQDLTPGELGLFFQDVRGAARRSGTSATDFGGLFIGLSFFLIISALLLTGMLFIFGVEQRSSELGLLASIGFRRRSIRNLFLGEGLALALCGCVLGTLLGLLYTRFVLHGLETLWKDAIAGARITMHIQPMTLIFGAAGAVVAAVVTMTWTLRRVTRRDAIALLRGQEPIATRTVSDQGEPRSRWRRPGMSTGVAIVSLGGALTLSLAGDPRDGLAVSLLYFGAGSLLLIGLIALIWSRWKSRVRREALRSDRGHAMARWTELASRNLLRRRGRSLATVILLGSGTFLVLSIGIHHLGPPKDPTDPESGTGGFELIGDATLPVFEDITSRKGEEAYGIPEGTFSELNIVPFRVRDGDEASCLNLSLAQQPKLVGVDPSVLDASGAFRFATYAEGKDDTDAWSSLNESRTTDQGRVIPAIGDAASVTYAMKKGIGDTLDYTDERGRDFKVEIVATVSGSILQGMLVIDARHFETLFPSESGYRMFLIRRESEAAKELDAYSEELTRYLEDNGLQVSKAAERLAAFNSVQNTYLLIFQLLGGLGLLLGTVGLGLLVMRNILERRRELALMGALGFRFTVLKRLVLLEHGELVGFGIGAGVISALLAVLPALLGGTDVLPWNQMTWITIVVFLSCGLWVWGSTQWALRGRLLGRLRDE